VREKVIWEMHCMAHNRQALAGDLKPGLVLQETGAIFLLEKSKIFAEKIYNRKSGVTQAIRPTIGNFLGGYYRSLGIPDLPVKIFDTPGFKDSDVDNLEKNKLLISSVISEDINAYVLVVPYRMSQAVSGRT